MRGWRCIGRIASSMQYGGDTIVLVRPGGSVASKDILAFSPSERGPLRKGTTRVVDTNGRYLRTAGTLSADVPAATSGDFVFVATALGAAVLKPVPA